MAEFADFFGPLYGVVGVLGDLFYLPQLWLLWRSREARRATSLIAWGGWAAIDIVQLLYALSIGELALTIVSSVNIVLQLSVVAMAAAQRLQDAVGIPAVTVPAVTVPVVRHTPLRGLADAAVSFRHEAEAYAEPALLPPERCAEVMRNLALCRYLYVGESSGRGVGIFAARRFHAGETIVHEDAASYAERCVARDELLAHGHDLARYAFQVGGDRYVLPRGVLDDLINHACEPSAGIRLEQRGYRLLALRDIAPGEEITYDYSTHITGDDETMLCRCGSPRCRGRVGAYRELPADRKWVYEGARVVPGFVRADIDDRPGWPDAAE